VDFPVSSIALQYVPSRGLLLAAPGEPPRITSLTIAIAACHPAIGRSQGKAASYERYAASDPLCCPSRATVVFDVVNDVPVARPVSSTTQTVVAVTDAVLARVRRPFPVEPIRTLEACTLRRRSCLASRRR
jgi:hypothetical protein